MPLGTTSGRPDGPTYNRVSAFHHHSGAIEFRLTYEDEDHRHRMVDGELDEVRFVIDASKDIEALAALAGDAAEGIARHISQTKTYQRHMEREARQPTSLNTPPPSKGKKKASRDK